ncbi:hypothetical protein CTI14_70295, partial [Methylobacterium radiotolerans]
SGSLSNATALVTNLGTWLSIIVLAVAVLLSVLLAVRARRDRVRLALERDGARHEPRHLAVDHRPRRRRAALGAP